MFSRRVASIIQGVWGQYATLEMLEDTDPRLSAVSPTILATKVDFPDATAPMIAVRPG